MDLSVCTPLSMRSDNPLQHSKSNYLIRRTDR